MYFFNPIFVSHLVLYLVTLGLLIGFLLRSRQHQTNRLLYWLAGVSVTIILANGLRLMPLWAGPASRLAAVPLFCLITPCTYLYVRAKLYPQHPLLWEDELHFLWFILSSLYVLLVCYEPWISHHLPTASQPLRGLVLLPLVVLSSYSSFPCLYRCWVTIGQCIRQYPGHPTALDLPCLKKLRAYTLAHTLLVAPGLLLLSGLVTFLGGELVVIGSYWLFGLMLVRLPFQESKQPIMLLPRLAESIGGRSTKRSWLSPEKQQEYRRKIEEHMQVGKPYLKQGYHLRDLSLELGIPQYYLSMVINGEFGMNFNDFINHYRIAYVKEKLKDAEWQKFTLEAIAAEAGFSNRITFFRAFTKLVGVTPSQYMAQGSSTPQ